MPARKRAQRAADTVSISHGELADGVEQTRPRSRCPLAAKIASRERAVTRHEWRNLARTLDATEWEEVL